MKIDLNNIEKKNPYQVPENYFQELTADIQEKVSQKTRKKQWIPLMVYKWSMVPAAILLVFAGVWFFNITTSNDMENSSLLAEISTEAMLNYLDEDELSVSELISLTSAPLDLIELNPDYLKGLDLEQENIDDLINTFDLNEIYL